MTAELLHEQLQVHVARIDTERLYRDELIDGIGRTSFAVTRGSQSETQVTFKTCRMRTDLEVVEGHRYNFEEATMQPLIDFPQEVIDLLGTNPTGSPDEPNAKWVDNKYSYSFDTRTGLIVADTQLAYGMDDDTLLEVPVVQEIPIFIEDEDSEELLSHTHMVSNDAGLRVARLVFVDSGDAPQRTDSFDVITASAFAEDEGGEVATYIAHLLRIAASV